MFVVCKNVVVPTFPDELLALRYFNLFQLVMWGRGRKTYLEEGNDGNCSQTSEVLCKLYVL